MKPIKLEDLVPAEAEFKLSKRPDKVYTLCEYSLRVKIWTKKRFGSSLKAIFDNKDIESLAELAFFMVKSKADFERDNATPAVNQGFKDDFQGLEDFFRCIVTIGDQIELMKKLLETIGISQPLMSDLMAVSQKELDKELEKQGADLDPNV